MDAYITTSSKHNLQTIREIMNNNPDEIKQFIKQIGVEKFVSNERVIKTIETFQTLYDNIIVPKTIVTKFDPFNLNKKLEEILMIDGIDNKESFVYKEFVKLNKSSLYQITINGLKFNITMFHNNDNGLNEMIIKRMMVLLQYGKDSKRFNNLKKTIKDSFDIYLVLYPLNRATYKTVKNYRKIKQELHKLKVKGCYNCSSGYTSFMVFKDTDKSIHDSATMLMTRIPEMLGLTTHEIGHLLGWDFEVFVEKPEYYSTTGMQRMNKLTAEHNTLLKELPLDSKNDVVFPEVFNNTNTTIIHTICNAIEYPDNSDKLKLFKELLIIEILYSIYHSAKILVWAGFNRFESFFDNDTDMIYHQKALLFEYTIARSFVLLNLNGYIKNIVGNPLTFLIIDGDNVTKEYTDKRNGMITDILTLMTGQSDIKESYKVIYNLFNDYLQNLEIEESSNNDCKDTCGKINMEYFCIDLLPLNEVSTFKVQTGNGYINYYDKYQKYKKKYLALKNII